MERFIAQKIITGAVRLEIRGPTGPSCIRQPLTWAGRGEGGGGGGEEKSRTRVKTGTGEGK